VNKFTSTDFNCHVHIYLLIELFMESRDERIDFSCHGKRGNEI